MKKIKICKIHTKNSYYLCIVNFWEFCFASFCKMRNLVKILRNKICKTVRNFAQLFKNFCEVAQMFAMLNKFLHSCVNFITQTWENFRLFRKFSQNYTKLRTDMQIFTKLHTVAQIMFWKFPYFIQNLRNCSNIYATSQKFCFPNCSSHAISRMFGKQNLHKFSQHCADFVLQIFTKLRKLLQFGVNFCTTVQSCA